MADTARPMLPLYQRSYDLDSEVGLPVVPKECPIVRLPYAPVQDGHIMGNCAEYKTRKAVKLQQLQDLTAVKATEVWDQKLVVVASQEERFMALKPINGLPPTDLTPPQYVFWECVGRARYNGETTAGPWSLTQYFKDSSFIFHLKSKFLQMQLLAVQSYPERHNGRTINSILIMLPRFYSIYKSHMQRLLEKLYVQLKQRPNGQIAVTEIVEHLDDLTNAQLKKLMTAHHFRRFYETTQVLKPSSKETGKPRKVTVLQLRNPQLKFEELNLTQCAEAKEEKQSVDFLSRQHAYVDMPLEHECLRAILHFGARGLSTIEMAQYVGINMQIARAVIKYLQNEQRIKDYFESKGKTRIVRYVAGTQAAAALQLEQEQLEQTAQQIQCKEEPHISDNVDIVFSDLPEISANLRQLFEDMLVKRGGGSESKRQLQRKQLIVQQIDKKCILQTHELIKFITESERNAGCKEMICRKSLLRLLFRMQQAELLNVYELTLQHEQRLRLYRLVTHPKIHMQHEHLQRELLRFKHNFRLTNDERLSRSENQPSKAQTQRKLQQPASASAAVRQSSVPKLLLARTMHEFLHYLVREQPAQQQPLNLTTELLQHWQRTEPALPVREYLEEWQTEQPHVSPYTQEINWRTFIPPLPSYEQKPAGWLFFMDAVDRLPLSLVMRIFRLDREVSEQLRPLLQHPVRQHYLLRQLSQRTLIPRLRLYQLLASTLRLLNHMGLLQVSTQQVGRDTLHCWVYLNARSTLLETTTSAGHNYNRISSECKYEQLKFEFTQRSDLAEYWAKLQHVCVYTKLGFRKHKQKREPKRHQPLSFVSSVEFEQAPQLDVGSVPGDRLGAGGLDSGLFAHQLRHWSWVKRSSKELSPGKASSSRATSAGPLPARKRISLMRLKLMPKTQSKKSRNAKSTDEARKRKAGPRDDIDRDALRNMRTLRVTWSNAEDKLLKLGRAVYLFIDAPLLAVALFHVGTICRDVIRQYLGICNKTTQACVRRMQFLIRMKRDLPDVPNWVYIMQTHAEFTSLYNEHFLADLKREYPTRTEFNDALLIHFVLILNKLHRLVNAVNMVRRQFLLPDNLEDYQRRFRECIPLNAEVEQLFYADPTTETELQVTVAIGVLHSILCCAKDKTLFNLQAFEIYKHFSEDVLNAAFTKARTDSLLVAVKRRNIQTITRQMSGPAHLLSSKYKYRLVYQRLNHVIYDAYYVCEQHLLKEQLQLSSPNFAQFLLLGEWLANRRLKLVLQLPANILTVDTSSMSHQRGTATDRILDHYSSIFDNAPQTEYAKRLETECSSRQTARVRFHPANISYRIQSSPYNQLSKLPLRAMHFFCAVDSLGQSVNISSARLEQGECPFCCIMRSGNYLNAVERIVYEHRAVFKQLAADAFAIVPLDLQLGSSTAASTTVTVSTGNLMTLVQQLEAYWRQQQQAQECKDVGKVLAERTLYKLTNWRTLCSDLLDYEAGKQETERTQEYEPALNKEERARVQDVFVVHLPTIQLEQAEQQQERVKQQEETRRTVLDKVAKATYWRYTDNTFETLLLTLEDKSYDQNAIRHMREILEHIEQRPLGVPGTELRRSFPLGKFLLLALHELAEHDLIKRVGVANQMYVHKTHMRNWVVHTFHIKRLERERVQTQVAVAPATPQAVAGQKRKLAELKEVPEQPSTSKQAKLAVEINSSEDTESDELLTRNTRRSKRCKTAKENKTEANSSTSEDTRDVIVMRPQPWIRVNASLNRRVLDRWMGTLLSECISHNGCTVHSLCLRFPHLTPVDVMFLLELLYDLGCIHLMELEPPTLHVETSFEYELKEQQVTELYDPAYTYVKVHSDAIGSLTGFVGLKKYNSEFI
ncbi:uncharacterized protein LOC108608402 [Drosophila busckii]|uniref:uncharacterized protein LOC108608402 n=1 Tax=Drosophila busckii TaxID=30019 RepID=UPI0014332F39|nr:uncharacterized protein LOC108608402 [Drosophila busckii]